MREALPVASAAPPLLSTMPFSYTACGGRRTRRHSPPSPLCPHAHPTAPPTPLPCRSALASRRTLPACLACTSPEEAARVYDRVAVSYYGPELADTNWPVTQELLAKLGPRVRRGWLGDAGALSWQMPTGP